MKTRRQWRRRRRARTRGRTTRRACTLEVLRREGLRWLPLGPHRDEERVRAETFDAIELDLSLLWIDVEEAPDT